MFLDFLKQPYPAITSTQVFTSAWIFGAFFSLFIYSFEPFGIGSYPDYDLWLIALIFGIITTSAISLFSFVYYLFERRGIQINGGTIFGEILVLYTQLALLGIAHMVAAAYIFYFQFTWRAFWVFHFYTVLICTIPAIIIFQYRFRSLYKEHTASASRINEAAEKDTAYHSTKNEVVVIKSDLKEETLQIPLNQFLFAITADNYVDVFYKNNDQIVKEMVRTNLSKIVDENPRLVRTHRSYIVNLMQVSSATGNALGLKLTIHGVAHVVPVARAYVPRLKPFLSEKLA